MQKAKLIKGIKAGAGGGAVVPALVFSATPLSGMAAAAAMAALVILAFIVAKLSQKWMRGTEVAVLNIVFTGFFATLLMQGYGSVFTLFNTVILASSVLYFVSEGTVSFTVQGEVLWFVGAAVSVSIMIVSVAMLRTAVPHSPSASFFAAALIFAVVGEILSWSS